jgi:hypothetical protein
MAEIDLNRDTIQFLIDRSREFHTRDDVSFGEEPDIDDEDWSQQVSSSFASDPYYQELKTTIEDLEPDQQMTLVALMWVGRGDFSADEWGDALKEAAESWTETTADYLIGTPMMSDYLAEGVEQLEFEGSA